ncbi:spermidine synthase [Mangrovactinospora gilvigrisea]|uniref:Spermidine synthase n=1 Tax=Mangrovactinospora gilvigrisea TaxID=1428644 RepID=A0A1J7BBC3_9ACTN|nr:spermidine synthase [Mangrovactinospora gilvigrisea]OIV35983.1 spermidine synthase [Mangrovactinospora gilvigrisea]
METFENREPEVLDRRDGPFGETVLRRRTAPGGGVRHEIISNGVFLMDTSDGRSERLLVRAALDRLDGRPAPGVLIGGLGVGFSLDEAAADPRGAAVTVVELDPAIVAWHREGPLSPLPAGTRVVEEDLLDHLRRTPARYDAICLDIDNGPDWTVGDSNAGLYGPAGLDLLTDRLAPGGVLTVWSAAPSDPYEARLRERFAKVEALPVPVPTPRAAPDIVYAAAGDKQRPATRH